MEYRDIYDKNKQLTGKTFEKSDGVPEGYFYLMVVCFMQNNKGQFLMQKRVPEKDGKWATTGGHPKAGENSLTGMITEIKEELGISVNPNELQLFKEAKGKNSFCDLYYLKKDIDIKDITVQEDEVESVNWLTLDEINNLFENGQFNKGHYMMLQDCLKFLNNKND